MKYILSSEAEANTAALFPTANKIVSMMCTLEEIVLKQPPLPVQCDISTVFGCTNQTIVSKNPDLGTED